jgi:hypothetical protein
MAKEDLLLSCDGDISLYKVDREILNNLDDLIEEFYKWKKQSVMMKRYLLSF